MEEITPIEIELHILIKVDPNNKKKFPILKVIFLSPVNYRKRLGDDASKYNGDKIVTVMSSRKRVDG